MSIEDSILDQVKAHHRRLENSGFVENRRMVAQAVQDYYGKRLNLEISSGIEETLEAFYSPDAAIIKLSHGAMIPHLGVFRMHVKAGQISLLHKDVVSFYLIDDQYYYNMYPETTRLGFFLAGAPPSEQKSAITVPIAKADKTKPLVDIPPPEEKILDKLENQVLGRFGPNLEYFLKEYGLKKEDVDKTLFRDGLRKEMGFLKECAKRTSSYADFCARYQIEAFHRTNPEESKKVLFLSLWTFKDLFRDRFETLFERSEEVNHIKNRLSQKQKEEGKQALTEQGFDMDTSPLWFLCSCGRRNRGKREGRTVAFTCKCGKTAQDTFSEARFVPDITATQSVSGSTLGLCGRIVGGIKTYAEVADTLQQEIFNVEPAPRFALKSYPMFYGVGEPKEGDGRASLPRVLCESDAQEVGRALLESWDENPRVLSRYLKARLNF